MSNMAKYESKVLKTIDGGIYDHSTRTITVETKEQILQINVDEFLESIDSYEVKIVAGNHIEE